MTLSSISPSRRSWPALLCLFLKYQKFLTKSQPVCLMRRTSMNFYPTSSPLTFEDQLFVWVSGRQGSPQRRGIIIRALSKDTRRLPIVAKASTQAFNHLFQGQHPPLPKFIAGLKMDIKNQLLILSNFESGHVEPQKKKYRTMAETLSRVVARYDTFQDKMEFLTIVAQRQ